MSQADEYYTTITIFFAPFSGGSVWKFSNNRYPLTGRKVKKLSQNTRNNGLT